MKSFAAVIAIALVAANTAPAQEQGLTLPENTTVLPETAAAATGGNPWTERVITIKAGDTLSAVLRDRGATPEEVKAIAAVLGGRLPDGDLKEGQQLRVLLSPIPALHRLQPVRIVLVDDRGIEAIVALSDLGRYVEVFRFSKAAPHPDSENGAAKSDRLKSAQSIPSALPGEAAATSEPPPKPAHPIIITYQFFFSPLFMTIFVICMIVMIVDDPRSPAWSARSIKLNTKSSASAALRNS